MEANNLNAQNAPLVACVPTDAKLAEAMIMIRAPFPNALDNLLRDTSTPDHHYTWDCHVLEPDCHHCHQTHQMRFVFAAFKTGAPAAVAPAPLFNIEMHDDGIGRDFNIGDYVIAVRRIEVDAHEDAIA